ncbi:MAG: hemerythrin domain-containing protein [Thermodesulfobacteriota bacterium]|nr:hemerythrin domain-containing protein [Thermodesulfobacteriota bacterium]
MQWRGPLMIEHRVIERMIALIERELQIIQQSKKTDPLVIDTVVDFIRVYADRTHHGKEEDILFRDLDAKQMKKEDRELMLELVEEHVFGRETTAELVKANDRYRTGDNAALDVISEKLRTLTEFYPKHIEKEDKVFFPAVMTYFSDAEEKTMLDGFWEFDKKMIHEKYKLVVEELEKK